MFTGIVRETGRLRSVDGSGQGSELEITSRLLQPSLELGHSVSVDGVCLTVTALGEDFFRVEVTPETLRRTNLGRLKPGDALNLEPAARIGDFLGGHLVQGHVDAVGRVVAIREEGNSKIFRFSAPREVLRHCTWKGSVAVDGVSLTISHLEEDGFEVTIIPHTLTNTNFSSLKPGDLVNLEADVISKYVESHVKRVLGTSGALLLVFFTALGTLLGAQLPMGPHTVLVYENTSGESITQFVVRLARFEPDILLEWESTTHQGTVHLFRQAVEKGEGFSLNQLFEVGVQNESREVMTVWLSREVYRRLSEDGRVRIRLNNLPLRLRVEGSETRTLQVQGVEREVPVLVVTDDRRGRWAFLDDADNPILVEYSTRFFNKRLKSVSHRNNSLRWIRSLPPVR